MQTPVGLGEARNAPWGLEQKMVTVIMQRKQGAGTKKQEKFLPVCMTSEERIEDDDEDESVWSTTTII